MDLEESARLLEASERFILTKEIAKIKCPILLVHGSRDRATEAYAKQIVAYRPETEISVVEGCNHAVATRAMSIFNALLEEWLHKLDLPAVKHKSSTRKSKTLNKKKYAALQKTT